jgi:hypothetical protein
MAEDGVLGPLDFETVPDSLRLALTNIYQTAARSGPVGGHFDTLLTAQCTQYFGKQCYGVNSSAYGVSQFLQSKYPPAAVDEVLDFVEMMAEEAVKTWVFNIQGKSVSGQADADIEQRVNRAFVRHRFGFQLENGQARRIGSPALDESVVGPALLALSRPGWEAADKSFRDALRHRRGGVDERDAAVTDAHAALEAAMKAAGLSGDRLSALAKSFRNSGLVPPQLEVVPDALDVLLKRSSAIRDPLGDAHGKRPDNMQVPDGIVDLMIHWTGAFIVFLADATRDK